jgi:SOS-response transcriptional repressor LexA
MKTLGVFFKAKREAEGWSSREAGKHAGMSHAHIIDIENDKIVPAFDKVVRLLKAYHVSMDELLAETGYMPPNVLPAKMGKLRKVPVISWVTAGDWSEACDMFQPGDAEDWIETDVKGECVFALRVQGDSMEPEFIEGEIIIINPHIDVSPGDYVVVKNGKGEATLKQLKKYGNTYVLHPLNPKYQDMEVKKGEFHIIGPVAKKMKSYK